MTQRPPDVDPHLIYGLYSGGGFPSYIFRIVLTLDLFSPLADQARTAEEVARQRGTHTAGTRALLDYMVGRQLLDYGAGRYRLTETARRFLVQGGRSYAGDYILEHSSPAIWENVLDVLRGGPPREPVLRWEQDAWLESYRPDRPGEARAMWKAAGVTAAAGLRVVDLAAGCGVKSLVLAQDDPGVGVTLVDVEAVIEVARDLADRMGVAAQVEYVAGDVFSVDLPAQSFDGVLLGQVTYYLDAARNTELFRRCRHALAPGGTLVIDAIATSDEPSIWASTVTLLSLGTSGATAHRYDDYQQWLEAAGFADVRSLGEHWVAARSREPQRVQTAST